MTHALHLLPELSSADTTVLRRLRQAAPAVAGEAAEEAAAAGPVPAGLQHALQTAIIQFLDPDGSSESTALALFHRLGSTGVVQGLSLHDLHAAQRIATGVAVQRLTERALRFGAAGSGDTGRLAQRVLAYVDRLKEAVTAGYAQASQPEPSPQQRRLLTLLLRPGSGQARLREAADHACWVLPRTLAAVALAPRPDRPAPHLLPDVLADPARNRLIVPDPDGPGRRAALDQMLEGVEAAIGPTVEPARTAFSLRLARQALDLAATGVIPGPPPVRAMEHAPDLVLMHDPELVRRVAERKLAPLAHQPPKKRAVYVQTLNAWFACGFNTPATAARLHVHAQTIRYRVRHLEILFGDDLYDPGQSFDYVIALRAWTLLSSPDGQGIWRV